ncbi:hypothetical protein [Hyunsoonleella jejuensis]|uniref:hypothetical protein n=1 Tax=Hyunsoonleella jejuensis TaxID=419940 RepID=UPI0015A5EC90|nr:hypothetical protein [Hyunsoonleella jejuensis]
MYWSTMMLVSKRYLFFGCLAKIEILIGITVFVLSNTISQIVGNGLTDMRRWYGLYPSLNESS